ncbi:SusC/RagA family TonB-linked outer membrane protein [Pedobacter aquatilis]|uniref:SusC/RagA family TonB-linked outer membrane protein n=1 Tax=Pedobacter aquatilis TaxID=351343 RepID=UPI00292E98D1|nr:SusC/RagA family TonB-linked outer membrane protein [Pedobacter aquatilis]
MKINHFSAEGYHCVLPPQFWRIMKLTTLIILIAFLQLSASTKAQITLRSRNASLSQVLKAISRQSGYDFLYANADLKDTKPVALDLRNASIELALEKAFAAQPLEYNISEHTVVVRKKQSSLLERILERFRNIDVRGKVTDEQGRGMAGVTVRLKSSSEGTITSAAGDFYLPNVKEGESLIFSFIGYNSQEVPASANPEIKMQLADSKLDEVQVTAYGKTSQRLSTGNISSVSASDLEKSPVTNPLLALQGRMPGLNIVSSNGFNNGALSLTVQGLNSIGQGNDPLIIIDGIPYTSEMLPNYSPAGGINKGNAGNPLSYVDPMDIESVSVLKDADATAIYGSRAANGALLITTKKGKNGPMQVTLDYQHGWGRPSAKMDMMGTPDYLQMRREAKKNDNRAILASDYDINGLWDQNRYTDWQKELIGQTVNFDRYTVGLSGGTGNTNYRLGSTYNRQTTVFPGDFNDRKIGLNFSLNSSSADQRFSIQFKASYMDDLNLLPGFDPTAVAYQLAPNAPSVYNPDGSFNWQLNSAGVSTWQNPIAQMQARVTDKVANLISSASLSYELAKGLSLKSNFGYNRSIQDQVSTVPLESLPTEALAYSQAVGAYAANKMDSWTIEPQLSYQRHERFGDLRLLLGTSVQRQLSEGHRTVGLGYPSTASIADINAASTLSSNGSSYEQYKYAGAFAILNYSYQEKYLLNLTARRDGSSHFGPNNRYHNFGAVGLGWVFSSEKFIQEQLPALSFGKLRLSYGSTGNDQIQSYAFYSLYYPVYSDIPYQNSNAIYNSQLTNPYLEWEETKKLNLGLDLGFLKDRIILKADYFRNRSSNQLLSMPTATLTGANSVATNLPAVVQNTGLELSLSTRNLESGALKWSTSFNLTIPRNKLVRYDDLATSGNATTLVVGKSLSVIRAYHYLGVNPANGQYLFQGANGQPTSSPSFGTDRFVYIEGGQRLYGGLENSLSYKNFSLSFLFQFVRQNGANNFATLNPGRFNRNAPVYVLDRWQNPGDEAGHQRYNSDGSLTSSINLLKGSDRGIGDASYIRLKNLSFAWSLPQNWQNKMHLKNARLMLQGQNLLTFSDYVGLDPETMNTNSLPTLRMLTLGLQASF